MKKVSKETKTRPGSLWCAFFISSKFRYVLKRQIKIYLFLFFKISPALLVLNKTIKGQTKISKAEKTCKTEMSLNFKSKQNVRNA